MTDQYGAILCDVPVIREAPVLLADLSFEQVASLSAEVLILFSVAFVFRELRRFLFNSATGRNG